MREINLANMRSVLSDDMVRSSILSAAKKRGHGRVSPELMNMMIAQAYYGGELDDWGDWQASMDSLMDYGDDDLPPDFGSPSDDLPFDDDDDVPKGSRIWFYPDYHEENDRMEFDKFIDFVDFCKGEGYTIPLDFYNEYPKFKYSVHCTLDPFMREAGRSVLSYAASYGEMYYLVCSCEELG